MDPCSDQVECNGHLRVELEDAIKLLGPGDFVRSHTPGKAADATQMLGFRKERFTALQRRFTQGPLDGDAGNVCDLRDQILLNLRRARRFAVKNRKGSQHSPVSSVNRRRPMRSYSVCECEWSNCRFLPKRICLEVCHNHLLFQQRRLPTWTDLRTDGQSVSRIVEARRKARNSLIPEPRTTPIDQVHAAVTIGGNEFYKCAQRSEHVGEWAARGHHLEQSFLAGELGLGPLPCVDVGEQNVPADDTAVRIAQGKPADLKPAIDLVETANTLLDLVGIARRHGLGDDLSDATEILWMNGVAGPPPFQLLQRPAAVFDDLVIDAFDLTSRCQGSPRAGSRPSGTSSKRRPRCWRSGRGATTHLHDLRGMLRRIKSFRESSSTTGASETSISEPPSTEAYAESRLRL